MIPAEGPDWAILFCPHVHYILGENLAPDPSSELACGLEALADIGFLLRRWTEISVTGTKMGETDKARVKSSLIRGRGPAGYGNAL
jgi:hypothetical protein